MSYNINTIQKDLEQHEREKMEKEKKKMQEQIKRKLELRGHS